MNVIDFKNEKSSFTKLSDSNIHINHILEFYKKHLKNLSTEVIKRLEWEHKSKWKMLFMLMKY